MSDPIDLEPIVLPADPSDPESADRNLEALDCYFTRLLIAAEQHRLATPELIEKLAELQAAMQEQADLLRGLRAGRQPKFSYAALSDSAAAPGRKPSEPPF